MMTFIMVKVLLILILTGQLGFCLSKRTCARKCQRNINFPFTIRNQFTTSLSSLQAAYEMRKELLEYQRDFYINAKNESKKSKTKAIYSEMKKMQQG
jgi:hypothetical protein